MTGQTIFPKKEALPLRAIGITSDCHQPPSEPQILRYGQNRESRALRNPCALFVTFCQGDCSPLSLNIQ